MAAYGRGCVADRFVCVSSGVEFIVGEILFFSRGDVERRVRRKLRVVKKLKLVTIQEQNIVPFGLVVKDTEEKMEIVSKAIKYKLFYFKSLDVSYLITMLSHFEQNYSNYAARKNCSHLLVLIYNAFVLSYQFFHRFILRHAFSNFCISIKGEMYFPQKRLL